MKGAPRLPHIFILCLFTLPSVIGAPCIIRRQEGGPPGAPFPLYPSGGPWGAPRWVRSCKRLSFLHRTVLEAPVNPPLSATWGPPLSSGGPLLGSGGPLVSSGAPLLASGGPLLGPGGPHSSSIYGRGTQKPVDFKGPLNRPALKREGPRLGGPHTYKNNSSQTSYEKKCSWGPQPGASREGPPGAQGAPGAPGALGPPRAPTRRGAPIRQGPPREIAAAVRPHPQGAPSFERIQEAPQTAKGAPSAFFSPQRGAPHGVLGPPASSFNRDWPPAAAAAAEAAAEPAAAAAKRRAAGAPSPSAATAAATAASSFPQIRGRYPLVSSLPGRPRPPEEEVRAPIGDPSGEPLGDPLGAPPAKSLRSVQQLQEGLIVSAACIRVWARCALLQLQLPPSSEVRGPRGALGGPPGGPPGTDGGPRGAPMGFLHVSGLRRKGMALPPAELRGIDLTTVSLCLAAAAAAAAVVVIAVAAVAAVAVAAAVVRCCL